jgi:hypothetical protein
MTGMKLHYWFVMMLLVGAGACTWNSLARDVSHPVADFKKAQAIPEPIDWGKPIPLSLKSSPVTWHSNEFHLVSLNTIQFNRDFTNHLTAKISAGVCTFDDVVYRIHAAVFDGDGRLLGTAITNCDVQRIWLGYNMTMERVLPLDFGTSLDYAQASGYMLSISREKVLTPDEWQK